MPDATSDERQLPCLPSSAQGRRRAADKVRRRQTADRVRWQLYESDVRSKI